MGIDSGDRGPIPKHRLSLARGQVRVRQGLLSALSPILKLDGLVFQIEAQGFLLLDIATRHPDKVGVVRVFDGVDITDGKGGRLSGIEPEVLL